MGKKGYGFVMGRVSPLDATLSTVWGAELALEAPPAGVIPTGSPPGGQGLDKLGNQSPPMVLLLATIALLLGN